IIPVMGSHGAATAEGQADVLAHYGIIEETMGCPIVSSLDVMPLGQTPEGIEVVMSRTAYESDGVMLLSRIKWHTDFAGKLESGVHKMMAIGLGKYAGAQRYHTFAVRIGMERVIRSVGRKVLSTGKMLGGLGILEDAYHSTAEVHALGVEDMERREEELLERVKSWAPRIPVKEIDLLIVDEMGKNISGAGMDTKIVNRSVTGENNVWPNAPKIMRIFVRDLTPLSYGNAVGLGMADVLTDRLYNKMDPVPTQLNALTASTTRMCATPIHFPTDRDCLEKVVPTLGRIDTKDATLGWIRNTMELDELMLSENLREEIRTNPLLEIVGEPVPLEFGADGGLVELLAPKPHAPEVLAVHR
ncbi:MAG TPA: lactate racemase domain-containing protein, partial [Bryobacterales bacterium]|nr:lactate racemase domain-containing protein [Bryobacterales bacterium]